ncbi:LysE family translocator [Caulobacter sp. 17J65-9]|uniref:LysE family translocator n=1 Tax=Caulobacter sp. 17J65-9 TaxID=2709382 RepID=UPI003204C116
MIGGLDPDVLPRFFVAMAVVELTPGPNMGYLASLSAACGRKAGLTAVAGVTLGLAAYMIAAAFGLTGVLLAYPLLYQALRWAGVIYLLWLAFEAWSAEREAAPRGPQGAACYGEWFRHGLFANLLNVKAAAFYVVLLPSFISPARPALPQALTLGAMHLSISVVVHSAIVLLAARAGTGLGAAGDHPKARRVRRAFAVAIAVVALWLAWDTRG